MAKKNKTYVAYKKVDGVNYIIDVVKALNISEAAIALMEKDIKIGEGIYNEKVEISTDKTYILNALKAP